MELLTSTGKVLPGMVKIGQSKKYELNFSASNVAEVTTNRKSSRRFSRSWKTQEVWDDNRFLRVIIWQSCIAVLRKSCRAICCNHLFSKESYKFVILIACCWLAEYFYASCNFLDIILYKFVFMHNPIQIRLYT